MIPGDIAAAAGVRADGTWRPAPGGAGGGPGTYATSLPLRLASTCGREPREVAAALAARLRPVGWVAAASVTGSGYLTVTVTPAALTALAARIPAAGDACVVSEALRGTTAAMPTGDLAAAADWREARRLVTATVAARLARAAGAGVEPPGTAERLSAPAVPSRLANDAEKESRRVSPGEAVAFAGAEAVRYALARTVPGAAPADPRSYVRYLLDNPFFLVRYAHARAAGVLRWAADLGTDRGPTARLRPEYLADGRERTLLGALSWMPERVAAAARRRRPDAFARHLESLAAAWLDCAEGCPALPLGGRAPRTEAVAAARLWLAAAARTALAAGLRLLDVTPPQRL